MKKQERVSNRKTARWITAGTLCLTVLLLMGCATGKSVRQTSGNEGKTSVTIALESNPTTGYQWEWSQKGAGSLRLTDNEYQGPSGELVGAGGKQVFVFSAGNPGRVTLTFIYRRPWEDASVDPIDIEEFQFIVNPDGSITEA